MKRLRERFRYFRLLLLRWWQRFRASKNTKLLAMSILIGITTGLATWLFRVFIDLFHVLSNYINTNITGYLGVIAPVFTLAGVGMLVGWLTSRYVGTERHKGITGIIESVAVGGGRLPYWQMPLKAVASALSIGGGASVGTEDPSVQIGSNLGAFIAYRFQLNEEQRRLIVASGAASATSAAFNAPIAGVFFALEVIMNSDFSSTAVGAIILSAVIASAFSQSFGITETTLQPLEFTFESVSEIIYFVPLGMLLVPFAALFLRSIFWQRDIWNNRTAHLPYPIRTGLAGMIVGIIGIFFPSLLGSGQEAMNAVLAGDASFVLWVLPVLALAKIYLTSMSIAGGFVGGVFTPSLFVGTMLGSLYGRIIVWLSPDLSDPRVFAIGGMAGMMVGIVRAPITAIMLVFELSNDYRMILPIMLVSVVCMYLTQVVEPKGVYLHGLARAGLNLQQGHEVDVMQGITVKEVMRPPVTVRADASLKEFRDLLNEHHVRDAIITSLDGEVTGIVTLSDLQAAYDRPDHGKYLRVAEICTRDVITAGPDETLWTAVRKMGERSVGRLPVVHPATKKLIGIINRHDVVRAYNTRIADRIRDLHHTERIRLQNLTGAHVFELTVTKHAPVANHLLRDIRWPGECTVASIQRGGRLMIPHGNTEILPRDVVTVVAAPEAQAEIARLFGL